MKEKALTRGGLHNHEWLGEEVSRSNSACGNELPIFEGRVFKESYEILMAGCATVFAIAYGRTGRNPNVKGKT
jgi:hypothetical protein